jgi:hypothetical protein
VTLAVVGLNSSWLRSGDHQGRPYGWMKAQKGIRELSHEISVYSKADSE